MSEAAKEAIYMMLNHSIDKIYDSQLMVDQGIIQFAADIIDKLLQKRSGELHVLKTQLEIQLELIRIERWGDKTKKPTPLEIKCPVCDAMIMVDSRAKKLICPCCGAVLEESEDQKIIEKKEK